jgi:hypothetical protein
MGNLRLRLGAAWEYIRSSLWGLPTVAVLAGDHRHLDGLLAERRDIDTHVGLVVSDATLTPPDLRQESRP